MKVAVVGAGVAGIAATLALARDGHDVVLIDRDGSPVEGAWAASPWESRPGCPQLNQGHAFLARGWELLERNAPDVLERLIDAGGNVTDGNVILPPAHHEPDLRSVAIRRPLIDRALMSALAEETGVEFLTATVTDVATAKDGVPRVVGLSTSDGTTIGADIVIDASGRRTKFPERLRSVGGGPASERRSPCGIVYYGRYFEMRSDPPPMFSPIATRGSLGHLGFAVFWQDGRHMAVGLHAAAADRAVRELRNEAALTATVRAIKPLVTYVDPGFAEPVSPVVAMGGLENVIRTYMRGDRAVVRGFLAIGDAVCHTDPVLAWGMSMALVHAFALPELLRRFPGDPLPAFHAAVDDELAERYRVATEVDRERGEQLLGRRPDPSADHQYVIDVGLPLLARTDPAVTARLLRRALAVDPPGGIEGDDILMESARTAIVDSGILDKVRHPTREELLGLIAEAV